MRKFKQKLKFGDAVIYEPEDAASPYIVSIRGMLSLAPSLLGATIAALDDMNSNEIKRLLKKDKNIRQIAELYLLYHDCCGGTAKWNGYLMTIRDGYCFLSRRKDEMYAFEVKTQEDFFTNMLTLIKEDGI